MVKRVVLAMIVVLAGAAMASAQATSGQTPSPQQPSSSGAQQPAAQASAPPPSSETRPATTTIDGDTGWWFVPIGEVLPAGRFSVSAYRVDYDYNQGFTDGSNWPVTFGLGLAKRAEIFGACTLGRRIDRDT